MSRVYEIHNADGSRWRVRPLDTCPEGHKASTGGLTGPGWSRVDGWRVLETGQLIARISLQDRAVIWVEVERIPAPRPTVEFVFDLEYLDLDGLRDAFVWDPLGSTMAYGRPRR